MNCIEHFGYYDNIVHFPEHGHTDCEILYLHKGHITVLCSGNEFDMTEGMIYIIPSCFKHRLVIKDLSCYRRTLVFLNPWIYSKKHCSDVIYNMIIGLDTDKPLIVKDDFNGFQLLNDIKNEIELNDAFSEEIIVSLLTELISHIIRSSGYRGRTAIKSNKTVSDIQSYIQENCGSQILISDIADKFFISKYYLSHIFKKQIGMSPKQFLIFTRLSKAYNLLHEPNLKIAEISEMCGFASPSDMTKKFREQYNISPNKFRKELFSKNKNNTD